MGRLNDKSAPASRGRTLSIGEVLRYSATDKETGAILKEVELVRTPQSYAQDLADAYNRTLTRTDIEWYVDASGNVALRDRPAFTERHTKDLKAKAEREARDYNHRQRYPITERK